VAANRDDEQSLIEAAQADPERFLELYDRHVDRVYAYVSRRVRSRAAAEDITSAVFEQALANLLSFEFRGAPFAAWLFRIAANALTDHWRRDGRDVHDPPIDVPDEREHRDLELRVSLFQLVDRLPEMQRRVIELRFIEGRSIRDAAASLDRSEGAVKQLQLRALENLRKSMGHHG
jgi:RNA polymerase sigma-70 factor (ECF subfamily)